MIGERYAPLAARQMLAEGKRTSPWRIGAPRDRWHSAQLCP